ncbi:probable ATP-dependent RNA helicase DDX27 [Macrobrachium nipponense]|uniref:probable ATP-dependent RNA helicase DDX27 n=1 Tax=Macrobrachium nipponense TaxID=159736 RepID=UPI0030C7E657
MNLSRSLLKAIDSLGYETPTPIQAATIPVALQGRDICGCAATGTGKTAAFMLPILERLIYRPPDDAVTRVLVLLPTRELCVQVFQVTKDLSKYTSIDTALSVGGLDLRTQVARLKTMPDIVIATPGRLLDHLKNTPNFGIDGVEILVLDEADRLLDEHFEEQMKDIMNQCSAKRQTMLFSATMTDKVQKLALVSLKNPVKVFVDSNTDVARNLRQEFIRLRSETSREAVLAYLVTRTFSHHTMVFVPRKTLCHRFVIMLGFLGIKAGELHANLKQTERLLSLQKFKEGENGVLIATDVAARGLDIKGVKTVINYTLPKTYARYVHRVGRTARAGHGGRSITLAADNEYSMLREIKKCSKSALFERVIDKDILDAYTAKLVKVEPLITKVFEEEQEEKKLRMMEEAVNKMENKLKDTDDKGKKSERNWCKDEFEDKLSRKHMRAQRKLLAFTLGKKKGPGKPVKQSDDPRLKDKMNRQVQRAKKAMKTQRLRTDHEKEISSAADNSKNKKVKRNKRKGSSFDQELTSIDRKSVKKFRAGPSYEEKKEAFEKKYPGKKFKPIRR